VDVEEVAQARPRGHINPRNILPVVTERTAHIDGPASEISLPVIDAMLDDMNSMNVCFLRI
jgi:hypothetical protein